MRRRRQVRIGSWATPTLIAVETVLVCSGLLSVGHAILVALALEAALAVTVISRGIIAVRSVRASRAAGRTGWAAAEDGLAQLLPRPVARALLIEARLWVCLLRWITGRHDGRSIHAHKYGRDLQMLLIVLLGVIAVEGAVVEMILVVLLPGTPWPWITLGLHAYALTWIGGFIASLHTQPHLLHPGLLRLRDSIFTEIHIPMSAISDARPIRQPGPPRSGLRIDPSERSATLTHGDTTIALTLDPNQPIQVDGRPPITGLTRLYTTANNPTPLLHTLTISSRTTPTHTRHSLL
ncbi:MAG: hypothetical protein JO287_17280 [Pseudonocardiales bacterium]|nr:hypothetical protein [Pseudonocardiales bacterium]